MTYLRICHIVAQLGIISFMYVKLFLIICRSIFFPLFHAYQIVKPALRAAQGKRSRIPLRYAPAAYGNRICRNKPHCKVIKCRKKRNCKRFKSSLRIYFIHYRTDYPRRERQSRTDSNRFPCSQNAHPFLKTAAGTNYAPLRFSVCFSGFGF